MQLKVSIQISPPPETQNKREIDLLLDEEVSKFEEFYTKVQRNRGLDGYPLASFERGVLKSYLYFASTERGDDGK